MSTLCNDSIQIYNSVSIGRDFQAESFNIYNFITSSFLTCLMKIATHQIIQEAAG